MIKKLGPKGGRPLKDIQPEMVEKLASKWWQICLLILSARM